MSLSPLSPSLSPKPESETTSLTSQLDSIVFEVVKSAMQPGNIKISQPSSSSSSVDANLECSFCAALIDAAVTQLLEARPSIQVEGAVKVKVQIPD